MGRIRQVVAGVVAVIVMVAVFPVTMAHATGEPQSLATVLAAEDLVVRALDADGGKGPRVQVQQCWGGMCALQVPAASPVYGSDNDGRTWALYVPVKIELGSPPVLVKKARA